MSASSSNAPAMTPGETYFSFLTWFARIGSVIVAGAGTAVVVGWLLDIAVLKSPLPGLATMKVNTGCGFLAAGLAVWLLHRSQPGSRSFGLARALSLLVAVLGGLTLAQDIFTLEFGIDQLILGDTSAPVSSGNPGRMAPATALSFLFIGAALLSFKARQPRLAASAQWLATIGRGCTAPSSVSP
jgi:two-component system, cell cycle sensor histidine kinase and response regulator CckA